MYTEPGYASLKHHTWPQAQLRAKPDLSWWKTLTECEFDYSWQPHPQDPPYTYVFGNQWWPAEVFPTMQYTVPGATEVKYVAHPKATLPQHHCNRWNTLVDCEWDYSWVPDPGDAPYIYVFGNQHWPAEIMPTVEYTVPGATERKFMSWPRATLLPTVANWTVPDGLTDVDLSWCPDPGDPPMTYQFGTQWQRTGGPVYTVPSSTEVKYVSLPTEPPYIYQFGTQHQRTGGPQYTVLDSSEVKYVDQIRIKTVANAAVIYEIDHLDNNAGHIPNTVKRVRYFDNYRDTLIRLAKSIGTEHEFIWVCSSICDYTSFDFSWHPEQWQSTMLHVFSSDDQKFGDTFYMHVPTFAARAEKKTLLEWYDVNYVNARVPRRPMPVIQHHNDSQVDAVKNSVWAGPLATFTNTDYVTGDLVTVPLWRAETKTIVPLSAGATSVIVPRTAVGHIQTQLYDHAYIDRTHRMLQDKPLDIVFISNGESNAEQNYKRLDLLSDAKANRLVRVDNVKGRAAAYHAAARASTTPWFFAVFAKLAVDIDFDFAWQPDRMQQPKHYIFHAKNPVNGLEYGHQAMIAYNKKLVLENAGHGLDFTLDSPHEVVPILSGTAWYADSPWMAWRTAFREVLKLRASMPDVESEYRLTQWLTKDNTPEQWSMKGAQDAVEYYDAVNGNLLELKKSYEWEWLASYAFVKRSFLPD
jgi:hypothetical protein